MVLSVGNCCWFLPGRNEKSEVLRERGRGAEREEEEFSVSAAREGEHEKGKVMKPRPAGGKSKKRQFKVSSQPQQSLCNFTVMTVMHCYRTKSLVWGGKNVARRRILLPPLQI